MTLHPVPSRRQVVASLAAVPLMAALPAQARLATAFDITRKGQSIGSHSVSASPVPGGIDVRIDIDIAVRVLGIVAYRYRLQAQERWRDGVLEALDASGADGGDAFSTSVRRRGDRLLVTGREGGSAPLDAVPTSYWTAEFLRRPRWIDIQAGRVMTVNASRIPDAAMGGDSAAQGWRVADGNSFRLDLWYGPDDRWVGCRFEARGAEVVYNPVTLNGHAPRLARL